MQSRIKFHATLTKKLKNLLFTASLRDRLETSRQVHLCPWARHLTWCLYIWMVRQVVTGVSVIRRSKRSLRWRLIGVSWQINERKYQVLPDLSFVDFDSRLCHMPIFQLQLWLPGPCKISTPSIPTQLLQQGCRIEAKFTRLCIDVQNWFSFDSFDSDSSVRSSCLFKL